MILSYCSVLHQTSPASKIKSLYETKLQQQTRCYGNCHLNDIFYQHNEKILLINKCGKLQNVDINIVLNLFSAKISDLALQRGCKQQSFSLLLNLLIIASNCLVYKRSENSNKCPELKLTCLNFVFCQTSCPKSKYIKFIAIEAKEYQQIFTFEELAITYVTTG